MGCPPTNFIRLGGSERVTGMKTATISIRTVENKPLSGLSEEEWNIYARIPDGDNYVEHPSFAEASTELELFGRQADRINVPEWRHFSEVPEESSAPARGRKSLSAHDEALLFLRYNYAWYRMAKLMVKQGRRRALGRAKKAVMWARRAQGIRSDLVRANMPLVVAMARRTKIPNVDFPDLVSEGNMALLRCIEKFDVSRGFKFSTYACRAILKSFSRLASKAGKYRQRFPMQFDPEMERSDYDVHKHEMQQQDSIDSLREILAKNRASLSEVERTIVMERFAVGSDTKRRTLAEVGRMVGLTNERVRQIQNHALNKIRTVLDEKYLVA